MKRKVIIHENRSLYFWLLLNLGFIFYIASLIISFSLSGSTGFWVLFIMGLIGLIVFIITIVTAKVYHRVNYTTGIVIIISFILMISGVFSGYFISSISGWIYAAIITGLIGIILLFISYLILLKPRFVPSDFAHGYIMG